MMSPSQQPSQPPSGPERTGTVFETDDDILQVLRSKPDVELVAKAAQSAAPPAKPPTGAGPYRPTQRPPIALLTVLDDGKGEGEVVRLRTDRFVIGRSEGDFLIPHDQQISARHIEITRQRSGDKYRWIVTDLQSSNGLFIRVSRAVLVDKAEFLAGMGRYRFEGPNSNLPETVDALPADAPHGGTRPLGIDAATLLQPALVELIAGKVLSRLRTINLLFLINISCFWFGCNNAAKELVKERVIYERERDFNLRSVYSSGWLSASSSSTRKSRSVPLSERWSSSCSASGTTSMSVSSTSSTGSVAGARFFFFRFERDSGTTSTSASVTSGGSISGPGPTSSTRSTSDFVSRIALSSSTPNGRNDDVDNSYSTRNVTGPTLNRSPGCTTSGSWTRFPLTNVPLTLSKSSAVTTPFSMRRRQCIRLTCEEGTRTVHSRERPSVASVC